MQLRGCKPHSTRGLRANLTAYEGGGPMQVPGATEKLGLVHNIGLGGAVVCSLLRRPKFFRAGGETGINR